ncbi:mechanosensitive ion channel family protein [Cellulomonas sp. APG4]|uniref:mechanosensitive ion channel family protein n=1 Tax=Cellulomonas sp. APG4 TaxID=1538656 RepID=UPI00137B0F14|nr:mechanosensitive ion channel family protein [Cellulomonas sp. APG4]
MVDGTVSVLAVALAALAGVVLALLLAEVVSAVVRAAGRRTWLADNLSRRARRPLRFVLVTVAVWIALRIVSDGATPWRPAVDHVALIALIVSVAWLVGALAFVVEDAAVARYRTDVPDNRHARRVRTQVSVLRRVTVAVLALCAVAGVLLTFEGARTYGATLLASAGVASIVLGLAAQSTLANVFAGIQLAFTDAIRVDDVVVVEGEWGRVEEITMTYVVVHAWDDRRLILPSTWFTQTPFQNWTRRAADLLGTVELDLDWAVPVDAMRAELGRLLQDSELWDHRVGVLQVTEATGGHVRVRALASAADAPTLFDLRCHVREGLVAWLQREHPEALPRTRWSALDERPVGRTSSEPVGRTAPEDGDVSPSGGGPDAPLRRRRDQRAPTPPEGQPVTEPGHGAAARVPATPVQHDTIRLDRTSRLFTGSLQAVERSKAFSGPGQDVIEEREQTAEGLVPHDEGDDESRRG